MISNTPDAEVLIGRLAAALDEEIALLELRGSQLVALSEAILQRDEAGLQGLFEEMEQTQQTQAETDNKLLGLRKALGDILVCPLERVTLTWVVGQLSGEGRSQIESRLAKIVGLIDEVRKQHLETVMLLSECARINRMLLTTLFPGSETIKTYGQGGQTTWRPDTGLVDAEL
ncbi:MAG: hypothetical protein KAX78_11620 [Phycisphaerae bacterium]|nr:hypothetical protein [Phycisphaerae bacterium]